MWWFSILGKLFRQYFYIFYDSPIGINLFKFPIISLQKRRLFLLRTCKYCKKLQADTPFRGRLKIVLSRKKEFLDVLDHITYYYMILKLKWGFSYPNIRRTCSNQQSGDVPLSGFPGHQKQNLAKKILYRLANFLIEETPKETIFQT